MPTSAFKSSLDDLGKTYRFARTPRVRVTVDVQEREAGNECDRAADERYARNEAREGRERERKDIDTVECSSEGCMA